MKAITEAIIAPMKPKTLDERTRRFKSMLAGAATGAALGGVGGQSYRIAKTIEPRIKHYPHLASPLFQIGMPIVGGAIGSAIGKVLSDRKTIKERHARGTYEEESEREEGLTISPY
jgi:hypothetical protein